jgi:hypothetical protein
VPRFRLLRYLYPYRDQHLDPNLHAVGLGNRNEHLDLNRDDDVDLHAGTDAHLARELPACGTVGRLFEREPCLRV